MEKKTKKLQLRKETIAVLNGERMAHVVGGIGVEECINGKKVVVQGVVCVCVNGGWACTTNLPEDSITLLPTDLICISFDYTCVNTGCNSLENTCASCGPKTVCNCA